MKLLATLLEIFFKIIEGIFKFGFNQLEILISGVGNRKESYDANFSPQRAVMSSNDYGFCLNGTKNLTVKNSFMNSLIIGGTGSGKSSVILIPSLYTMKGSFIIHDCSGELYNKTAGFLHARGFEIKIIHFNNPSASSGFNPLLRANTSSEIQKISAMLVENSLGKNPKDPFWSKMAEGLLSIFISILKTQEEQFQNPYNLRQLLNYFGGYPEKVDALFSGKYVAPTLFSEYKSFIAYDQKVVSGVTATCKAALQIFNDEAIAQITSYDNIDFSDFRRRPVALFIQNSVADQRYYSILTSIFFEQFFSYIMSRFPNENEQDIFFLVDEASSLKLPTLPLAVANVRKHRAGIMLIVQDFNQLVHCYDRHQAEAIKSNCFAKMYFTGQGIETAKELEQILGKFEFEDKEKRKHIRSLMTADEIRQMPSDSALLICGNQPPVLAKLTPYYKNNKFCNYDKISAPPVNNGFTSLEPVPVLDLNVLEEAQ